MIKIIEIEGRVSSFKVLGGIIFLQLENGLSTFTVICEKDDVCPADYDRLIKVKRGHYIECKAKAKNEELHCTRLLSYYESLGPINEKLKNLRNYSKLLKEIRTSLEDLEFMEVRLPTIHYGETKAERFNFNFFGHNARLSSSNALHLTVAATNFCKIYSIQSCYRAEPSKTSKHLSEFDMLEIAFIGKDLEELIDFTKQLVINISKNILAKTDMSNSKIPFSINTITYQDLNKKYSLNGKGLGRYEKEIAKDGPVFVTYFPKNLASWAAFPHENNSTHSLNLLVPGVGEVAEGCLRNTEAEMLKAKFEYLSLWKQLGWYVKLNTLPAIPVLSLGIGIERLAMWLFGIDNIRDTKLFYRDKHFSEIDEGS